MTRNALPALAFALLAWTVCLDARAQPAERDRVEHLYREGRAARERGELDRSLELLREAWALRKTHDVAASLAQVEYELGNVRDAAEHLAYACEHLPAAADPERVERLFTALEQIKKQLVTFRLVVEPGTARLTQNGAALGLALSLPKEVYADPGTITLSAELEGHARWVTTLHARAGETRELRVRLEKLGESRTKRDSAGDPAPAATPDAPAHDAPRSSPGPLILSASLTGVCLTAGIALWLSANSKESSAEERLADLPGENRCGAGTPYPRICRDARDQLDGAKTLRGWSYAAFGASAVGAAVSYLVWPRQEQRRVSFGASLQANSLWAAAEGRF